MLEQRIHAYMGTNKRRPRHLDPRVCRMCFKTKFVDGVGRACTDCSRRVCARCGCMDGENWTSHQRRVSLRNDRADVLSS